MSKVFGSLRRVSNLSKSTQSGAIRFTSIRPLSTGDVPRYQQGDRVIIDGVKISKPLIKDGKTSVSRGEILHNDILGREASKPFFARSSRQKLYRIEQPTLTQYISQTPRLVTPIYSEYAETIVSLLDIHATPFRSKDDAHETFTPPPLEILDSGTGHGSLTLHLARAIANANPPPLNLPIIKPVHPKDLTPSTPATPEDDLRDQTTRAWTEWKRTRRAVIHSVEAIGKTSRHAETVVRGFRQGQYWPHIDFHHSDISTWLSTQLAQRNNAPFLSYVFLDLPGVQERLKECFPAMHDGAKALIFVPSITQVTECVKMIKGDRDLHLNVDTVVELGEGISNGRTWDVRAVTPRTLVRGDAAVSTVATPQPGVAEAAGASDSGEEQGDVEIVPDDEGTTIATTATSEAFDNLSASEEHPDTEFPTPDPLPPISFSSQPRPPHETVMICRPQIGERIVGGGFVAVFSKMSPEQWELQYRWRGTRTGVQKKMFRS